MSNPFFEHPFYLTSSLAGKSQKEQAETVAHELAHYLEALFLGQGKLDRNKVLLFDTQGATHFTHDEQGGLWSRLFKIVSAFLLRAYPQEYVAQHIAQEEKAGETLAFIAA